MGDMNTLSPLDAAQHQEQGLLDLLMDPALDCPPENVAEHRGEAPAARELPRPGT